MKKKNIAIIISIIVLLSIVTFGKVFMVQTLEVNFDRVPQYTTKDDIIKASNVKLESNIFNLGEKEIAKNINKAYPNNSIYVRKIERVFPNKIIFYISERIPIFLIPIFEKPTKVVLTDKDFQMTEEVDLANMDTSKFIIVDGMTVSNTFDTQNIINLHKVTKAFFANGYTEEGLTQLFSNIKLVGNKLSFLTRNLGQQELVISLDDMSEGGLKLKVADAINLLTF